MKAGSTIIDIIIDIKLSKQKAKFMESAIHNHRLRDRSNYQMSSIQQVDGFSPEPLLTLNAELDNLGLPYEINEPMIESLLQRLKDSGAVDPACFWLVMARIFELTLICAGHYADNCEFSAAGDLLFNPREVLIHRNGYPRPMVKQRHGRISDQLNQDACDRKHLCLLLRHEVTAEVVQPAILPYAFEQIQYSGMIASWYLRSAQERMKKIADTIGFLAAWHVSNFEDFHNRLNNASTETSFFVGDHLCRFDTRYFKQLGREINRVIDDSNFNFEFLVHQ